MSVTVRKNDHTTLSSVEPATVYEDENGQYARTARVLYAVEMFESGLWIPVFPPRTTILGVWMQDDRTICFKVENPCLRKIQAHQEPPLITFIASKPTIYDEVESEFRPEDVDEEATA